MAVSAPVKEPSVLNVVIGCNDHKLIAAICTRTKLQIQRTKRTFRNKFDKDLREEIQQETGGGYRKLLRIR